MALKEPNGSSSIWKTYIIHVLPTPFLRVPSVAGWASQTCPPEPQTLPVLATSRSPPSTPTMPYRAPAPAPCDMP
jgi:hypothetical protein